MKGDPANAVAEDIVVVSGPPARDAIRPERVHNQIDQWDRAAPGGRLRLTDLAPIVCPTADMHVLGIKVDVAPTQPTQLARPHPGERRGDEQRVPLTGVCEDRLQLNL